MFNYLRRLPAFFMVLVMTSVMTMGEAFAQTTGTSGSVTIPASGINPADYATEAATTTLFPSYGTLVGIGFAIMLIIVIYRKSRQFMK